MPVDLDAALAHHREGHFDRASALYQAALAENPTRHDLLHLLGLIALQTGDHGRAVDGFAKAIALSPSTPEYHADLAEAFLGLGRFDQALACWREALRLRPEYPQVLCNLGAALLERERVDEAIPFLREAARLCPDLAPIHNNLGNAYRLKGDVKAAANHFREACRLAPERPEVFANLGQLLLDLGEISEALACCKESVRLRPTFVKGRIRLGNALIAAGLLDDAEACFRETIRLEPTLAIAHAGLAGILEQQGRREQALVSLRETIRLDPQHAGALARLANILRDKLPDAEQTAIATLLANPSLNNEARFTLLFGQGALFDAQNRFEPAAQAFAHANALQAEDFERRGFAYQPLAFQRLVDQIVEAFNPKHFERVKGLGLNTDRPVFVVGLPRSGTTLVEQILASHPKVFGGGELGHIQDLFTRLPELLPPTSAQDVPDQILLADLLKRLDPRVWQHLGERYLKRLDTLKGAAHAERIVDKLPENTLHLGLIATMFPKATIIHCRRDLRDVGLSCWTTHFGQLRWTSRLDHIAARFAETERLMAHWEGVLPLNMLEVDYERLVDDPEPTARAIVAHAKLDWSPLCLDFHQNKRSVQTASVNQVRQPIYRTSVGRWRNYQAYFSDWFAELETIKEEAARRRRG